ncbi:hypothetical protein GCM10009633_23990 [Janibacter melonis]|uniref:hypothetical protein n=1 Tax=Janibacter melonis TaxID=262209 RepID=UPI001E2A08A5|nr:hypothetical protein [Janibacter melonis]MCB5993227.1 hypothetical protein [Janibacter melonis]
MVQPASTLKAAQREAAREVTFLMGRHEGRPTRRGLGAPVRVGFLDDGAGGHPMATLLSSRSGSGGGRGGKTRLALLLSLLWVAGGEGHSATRPASFWARLIGLPDPQGTGARAINSTWAELETRGFVSIRRSRVSGEVPTVTLMNEARPGQPYQTPTGEEGDRYLRVPERLWTMGKLDQELTGAGLAMLVIAIRTYDMANRKQSLTFPAVTFKERYGLGESTRKKGLQNLVDLDILDRSDSLTDDDGGFGRRMRPRNTYEFVSLGLDN